MPPAIALTGCVVFVAALLVLDFNRRTSVSAAMWIPTLLLLVVGSRPLSLWARGGTATAEWSESSLDFAFFLIVLAGSWIVSSFRGVKWTSLFAANLAIALCYVYFASSALWS